ncbi:hypothetical protein [Paenibacillus assamensis]|uniref:hypothetical protein n=1 Tax=Paenibacillus assamensis TaxID=311244 RepID=UPI00048C65EC|nr:hypothetical protein [Paenibacillus assamensis]
MKKMRYSVLMLALLIMGCSSSPLKSDIEIKMNTAYNTNFDYIDTIKLVDDVKKEQITIDDPKKIEEIINKLTIVTKLNEHKSNNSQLGEVIVMTSKEGEKYNSKQKIANLSLLEVDASSTIVQYESDVYLVPINIIKLFH